MSKGVISKRQEEVLEYIKEAIRMRGYPPSVRDICAAVGLKSTSSVHAHLTALEEAGYIRRDPSTPRGIEVIGDDVFLTRKEMASVPIIGQVAAGLPLLAEQNIEDYFPIPVEYLPNKQVFMLRVKGDSMVNAGILNGDIIIAAHETTAKDGDIVVALIGDSATVKRFFREEARIRLQPENDAMDPIYADDKDSVRILGKVVGVLRFM